jgi:hypothetical protein
MQFFAPLSGARLPRHRQSARPCRGTTFERLAEEVRYSAARELLEITDLPVSEVASALSYSNAQFLRSRFPEIARNVTLGTESEQMCLVLLHPNCAKNWLAIRSWRGSPGGRSF